MRNSVGRKNWRYHFMISFWITLPRGYFYHPAALIHFSARSSRPSHRSLNWKVKNGFV